MPKKTRRQKIAADLHKQKTIVHISPLSQENGYAINSTSDTAVDRKIQNQFAATPQLYSLKHDLIKSTMLCSSLLILELALYGGQHYLIRLIQQIHF